MFVHKFSRITFLIVVILALLFNSAAVFSQDNSLTGKLKAIEVKVYFRSFDDEPLISRLRRLETELLGNSQSGSMIQRVSRLEQEVLDNLPARNSNSAPPQKSIQEQSLNSENLPQYNYYNPPASSEYPQSMPSNSSQYQQPVQQKTLPPVYNNSSSTNDVGLNARFNSDITDGQNAPTKEEIKKFKELKKQQRKQVLQDDGDKKSRKKKKKKKKKQKEEEAPEFDPQANSYYDTLMYVTKNKVIRFKKMPVPVFLPEGGNLTYRKHYRPSAIRALNLWKVMSDGQIDYVITDIQKKAKISVYWLDNNPISEGDQAQTPPNVGIDANRAATGNIMSNAGIFVPGYYGYAASLLGYLVGGAGNTAKIRNVRLQVGTLSSMKLNEELSSNLIETITSREFGRSIGLSCYSVNPQDIMFSQLPQRGEFEKKPSARDLLTAIELYNAEPDYTD